MAHKLKITAEEPNNVWFPPEADGDFDTVDVAEIATWREKLAERFDIGTGKMTAVDDPASARRA